MGIVSRGLTLKYQTQEIPGSRVNRNGIRLIPQTGKGGEGGEFAILLFCFVLFCQEGVQFVFCCCFFILFVFVL